jgi:uncharacterized delta-60 repeat protein
MRLTAGGSADSTFGAGGTLLFPENENSDEGEAVALQSDGKIVLAVTADYHTSERKLRCEECKVRVMRLNNDGSTDTGFGNSGVTTLDINTVASELLIQKDGKILVSGRTKFSAPNVDFLLARFNNDGSPDRNFGNGGFVTTDMDSVDAARPLVQQEDGKIIVAGNSGRTWELGDEDMDFAIVRYHGEERTKRQQQETPER